MKKLLLVLLLASFIPRLSMAQESTGPKAKKPTIMVIPADNWMDKNGFVLEINNQGKVDRIFDYETAFVKSAEISNVIAKINGLMVDRGFPLKSMEQELKSLKTDAAEDEATTSSTSQASLASSALDKLKMKTRCDIIMKLGYTINRNGPEKSVTFTLEGLDSYTNKAVANETGTGSPSFSSEVSVLLEEAVLARIDNFNAQLQSHFEDMFANGREVQVRIKVWDNSETNLETEFDSKELTEVIDDWFAQNTVNGRYNQSDATENMMLMEQVRIPLFTPEGKAMDTKQFVTQLRKFLNAPPYNLTSKVTMQGLGKATLIIGEK